MAIAIGGGLKIPRVMSSERTLYIATAWFMQGNVGYFSASKG